jgi:hypothetical protein
VCVEKKQLFQGGCVCTCVNEQASKRISVYYMRAEKNIYFKKGVRAHARMHMRERRLMLTTCALIKTTFSWRLRVHTRERTCEQEDWCWLDMCGEKQLFRGRVCVEKKTTFSGWV